MTKVKTIHIRLEEPLYNFIKKYAIYNRMNVSELVRSMIIYFFMAYTLGEIKTPLSELKKIFMSRAEELEPKKIRE